MKLCLWISYVRCRWGVDVIRYFIDGSISVLISNKNLYQHHFKCGYKVAPNFPYRHDELEQEKYHYHLAMEAHDEVYSHALKDYKNLFGLDNFIFLIKGNKNYIDYFIFSSSLYNIKL
ncbi:hypothetical protein Lsha_0679 [Legionella shakespearei DSM 23087]|uniref:Uncharacterized protein n=1 Tax=Legionella shakespearei DSM 23087 TaxID=1122169 RepID=A0A0W0Z2Z9_9GAMM|nr:hypothetical protein Lsha_0679 [Legionella shakespearei DSM 23087]